MSSPTENLLTKCDTSFNPSKGNGSLIKVKYPNPWIRLTLFEGPFLENPDAGS
jgi:hypothetical protein